MDLLQGLSAANLALGLVKDLREIDRSVDEAGFKLKIAEINSALADAKVALADANISLSEREKRIQELLQELDELKNGEPCPKCRKGKLFLRETRGHSQFGAMHFGVEKWDYVCNDPECGFEQTRIHDPHGAMKEIAKRR